MTDNEELNPRKLTFSQAQGYERVPGPLALGEVSEEARIKLWDLLAFSAWHRFVDYWGWNEPNRWVDIFQMLHSEFHIRPLDEFGAYSDGLFTHYRDLILDKLHFNEILDLFQMIMRHPDCPRDFTLNVSKVFKECRLAYVIDTRRPATILPAATKQEGEAILGAIKEFREAGLSGPETHLRKAGGLVNSGDWPGAVRESINAVESVARQLAPRSSQTLGPALASLERNGRLHPALKEAFSRLYGYTSDEEGIRHSLMDNAESSVGRDEAVFMLGACASFASYLWRRHQSGS